MEGHEDEIGLAKASPFSFLPEASLQKDKRPTQTTPMGVFLFLGVEFHE